jgi:hypothetical protein
MILIILSILIGINCTYGFWLFWMSIDTGASDDFEKKLDYIIGFCLSSLVFILFLTPIIFIINK